MDRRRHDLKLALRLSEGSDQLGQKRLENGDFFG